MALKSYVPTSRVGGGDNGVQQWVVGMTDIHEHKFSALSQRAEAS